jgi:putative flippase GtrA
MGIIVQMAVLAILLHGWRLDYLPATAVAVELTVLHNFCWHERFTWADRPAGLSRDMLLRLARFNFSTGAASVAGNLLWTSFLVEQTHWPPVLANLASIALCSVLNFWVSDYWVFRPTKRDESFFRSIAR